MSRTRQVYWRQVRAGAWELSKKNFQWTLPLAFGAVVFLLTALFTGFEKAREGLIPRLIIGAATVLFAVVGYAYNLFRSAADIYGDQLKAVERIERDRDTQVSDRDTRIRALQLELAGKQKDQELADKLTRLRRFAISDLLNRQPNEDASDIEEWRAREAVWGVEVLDTMRAHGCTLQDIHKVEMIGTFQVAVMHKNWNVSKDLSMLTIRLDRMQQIIDKYAE